MGFQSPITMCQPPLSRLSVFIRFPLQGLLSGNYTFKLVLSHLNGTLIDKAVSKANGNFSSPLVLYRVSYMLAANPLVTDPAISHDEIEPVLLVWNPATMTWGNSCMQCGSQPVISVNKTLSMVTALISEINNPLQVALFFSYPRQYGVFSMEQRSTCVQIRGPQTTTRLTIVRKFGAYGDVTVPWVARAQSGFSSLGEIERGTLSFPQGQWQATVEITLPSPTDDYSRLSVSLTSVSGGGLLDQTSGADTSIITVLHNPAPNGVVEFDLQDTDVSADENSGRVCLNLHRHCGDKNSTQIQYTVYFVDSDGQTVVGSPLTTSDFSLPPTITIQDGSDSGQLCVDIIDDSIPELNETLSITLQSANPALLGFYKTAKVTIRKNDNPHGIVELSKSSASVLEGSDQVAQLEVVRTKGLYGAVMLHWSTGDLTAVRGVDFSPRTTTVTLAEGQSKASLEVTIITDSISELQESFSVLLDSIDGGAELGSQRKATVTIQPRNDNRPIFDVLQDTVTIDEATITVPMASLYTAKAADPDLGSNGRISYSIASSNCSWAAIDSQSGRVSNTVPLMTWNASALCHVEIQAEDQGTPSMSSSLSLLISIDFTNRCHPGTWSTDGKLPCQPCLLNEYQPKFGQRMCSKCPTGTETVNTGSTIPAQCRGETCNNIILLIYYTKRGSAFRFSLRAFRFSLRTFHFSLLKWSPLWR